MCWSDDTKLKLFRNVDVAYVWRREGEAFDPTTQFSKKNIVIESIILWGCFATTGTGILVLMNGIMKKENHDDILKDNMQKSARSLFCGF